MIDTYISPLIRNLGDTLPIFFLRIVYHILCFAWGAPPILWLIPYIGYFDFITCRLPPDRFTATVSRSSFCPDPKLCLQAINTFVEDRAYLRDGLCRLWFILISSLRIASLLLLLQKLTNFLVLNIAVSKGLKGSFLHLSGLLSVILSSGGVETQADSRKAAAANTSSTRIAQKQTLPNLSPRGTNYPQNNLKSQRACTASQNITVRDSKFIKFITFATSVTFTDKLACHGARATGPAQIISCK